MSEDDEIARQIITHGGWFATLVAALGLWILKRLISSQFTTLLAEHRQLQLDVKRLGRNMAVVKVVLGARQRGGGNIGFKWPSDEEDDDSPTTTG